MMLSSSQRLSSSRAIGARRTAGLLVTCVLTVLLALAAIGQLSLQASAASAALDPAATCPMKIMAVGDSVTLGSGSAVSGYRTVVNNRMKVDALQAVWVGSQTTKLPLHEAYSGIEIQQINNNVIDTAMNSFHADIILLMAGTADIEGLYPAVDADTMASQMGALVDKILTKWPATMVVLASVPPVGSDTHRLYCQGCNC